MAARHLTPDLTQNPFRSTTAVALYEAPRPEVIRPNGDYLDRGVAELSLADRGLLRDSEARHLARALAAAETLEQRASIYATCSPRLLSMVTSRWPGVVPKLNGEYEWIAITLADLD
jgi:hypothetical protein